MASHLVASHFGLSTRGGVRRWMAGSLKVVQVGLLKWTDTGRCGFDVSGEVFRMGSGELVFGVICLDCLTFILPFLTGCLWVFFCFNALDDLFLHWLCC